MQFAGVSPDTVRSQGSTLPRACWDCRAGTRPIACDNPRRYDRPKTASGSESIPADHIAGRGVRPRSRTFEGLWGRRRLKLNIDRQRGALPGGSWRWPPTGSELPNESHC
jgi:hypothetical protein